MPDIKIIKIKLRRGLNSQRLTITPEQGEPIFTTDTARAFIGDGSTAGGIPMGSKNFTPIASNKTSLNAVVGDVVNEGGLLYQLSATDYTQNSSWGFIGTRIDNTYLAYTSGMLSLKLASLTPNLFASTIVYNSGAINSNASGLSARIDNSTIKIASNALTVGIINANNINLNSVAGSGLVVSASALAVNVDNTSIVIDAGVVSLSTLASATTVSLCATDTSFAGFSSQTSPMTGSTIVSVVTSGSTVMHSLTSAGFLIVDFGAPIGKKAVPIFNIPSDYSAIS